MNVTSNQEKTSSVRWYHKLALVGCGLLVAIGLMLAIIVLFPNLVAEDAPLIRQEKGETYFVEYRVNDGDLFGNMPGSIRPVAEEDNIILTQYEIRWDENGFRIPAMTAESYSIAALGDSFTEAVIVERPWVDLLAETLDTPIYNFGYRAYGPVEIAQVAEEFVAEETYDWVLYAYFAGNDLPDINRSFRIEDRDPVFIMQSAITSAADVTENELIPDPNRHYDFPMPVIIGEYYYEMAFLPDMLWSQVAPPSGFEESRNLDVLDDMLQDIVDRSASTTCHAVIFIPAKDQLYYEYIVDSERRWLRENYKRPVINDDGWLDLEPDVLSEDQESAFIAELDEQHDAVEALAIDNDWYFIDLLPPFQDAVSQGELLYFPYDSHWNPNGHAFATTIIAEFMRSQPDCSLSS